jgi:hypothetical protein
MEVHRTRVLPAVSGTQGACRGGNSAPGGSERRDCAKIVRARGSCCEAEGRVGGSGPPYLWTYRVSLTGVTAILARLAGRRSERMPRLRPPPRPRCTSAIDRRFRGSAPRRIVTAPAHAGRRSHCRTVIGRPGSSPWRARGAATPLPRIRRYALGYRKLEDRSARTSRTSLCGRCRRSRGPPLPPPRTAGQATQRTGATFFAFIACISAPACSSLVSSQALLMRGKMSCSSSRI